MLKCNGLIVMRLNERVRHGAVHGDAEKEAPPIPSRCRKSSQITCPRSEQTSLGAMRTTQTKIDQQFSRCHQHRARCFGRNQSFEMKQIDQPAFDQLRLRDGRGHTQNRFVREEYRPFRHGVDVAGEAEIFQVMHES